MQKVLSLLLVATCLTFAVGCSNSKANENKESTKASTTEPTAENVAEPSDADYVNSNNSIVEYDGTVYCADKTGVWKTTDGGESKKHISDVNPAKNIATNGKTVFFSTFNGEDDNSENLYEKNCSIYCVNADGTDEHKVLDTVALAQPICVKDNILYYNDIKDDESKEYPAAMQYLKSYDLSTGNQKVLAENAATVTSIGSKIIYRELTFSIDDKSAILHSYDTQTGKTEDVSNASAADMKVIDGKLYFSNLTLLEGNKSKIAMYCYNPESEKTDKLFEKSCDMSAMIQCFNSKNAYYYNADESNSYKYYRVDLKTKQTKEITDLPDMCDLAYFVDDDVYYRDTVNNDAYYFDGDKAVKIKPIFGDEVVKGYYQGAFFYTDDSYISSISTKVWSLSENEVEKHTIADVPSTKSEDTVSYDEYLGLWIKEGLYNSSVGVEFKSFNGNNATFIVYKNSANYSQVTQTNEITAEITDGKIINFEFTDTFSNKGSGTITLNGDTIHLFADSEDLPKTGFGVYGDCDLHKQ